MSVRRIVLGIVSAAAAVAVFAAIVYGSFPARTRLGLSAPLDESSSAKGAVGAPGVQAAPRTGAVQVPILVYHIVRPSYPSDSAGVKAIAVTPETFDAQLQYLKTRGYRVVGFGDLERSLAATSSAPLPPKPIIISFDDGWRDQFQYAFPILQKYGDAATFFVFTRGIGRRGFLGWDDLRRMQSAGMTIGAHSLTHPFLTKVTDPAKLWGEIYGSKRILEEGLGRPVTEFAYPFGQYDPAIISLVKLAGFRSARGDLWKGSRQSQDALYTLSAMNAPTTTATFAAWFP